MTRIASTPFELTLENGEKKQYVLGEQIAAEHVDHWWAQAHSAEVDLEAEAARGDEQAAAHAAAAAELKRLKDENSHLLIQIALLEEAHDKRAAEVQALRAEAHGQEKELAKLRAQCDELKAELAAGTEQAKDGGKKKS